MHVHAHRLLQARWQPSPNCDARPDPADITLLVIHGISLPPGEFGGAHVDALFGNCLEAAAHPYFAAIQHLRVSAHLFIDRAGTLTQYVCFDRRAWHAGASVFAGRAACNDYSIGVELEGADETPYTAAQYAQLCAVTRALLSAYPGITPERIVGHSDIAPGRKTDPGPAFDWAHFRTLLAAAQE
ncbi:MAG: 1,6-anhydro-N-acetylmuramyl-L-alanine amidase AmpD [Pseudomonadales bacterium]|jgi:AmpD protein|nr:1,6-anhydro-N-acetylmuramyl-L-alanine amidase AmpD [Pseudomonadales bacterium]